MPPPFERAEYEERLRRTRAAMRVAGLDALLVFHQEHMFYLAGYDQIGYWVYQVLIVPATDAPMTAVVRKVDELLVRDGGAPSSPLSSADSPVGVSSARTLTIGDVARHSTIRALRLYERGAESPKQSPAPR